MSICLDLPLQPLGIAIFYIRYKLLSSIHLPPFIIERIAKGVGDGGQDPIPGSTRLKAAVYPKPCQSIAVNPHIKKT